ncbi:hypothetical protein [Desulfonema magnum]|uniref:DUF3990 domain-containing protein n=1 Tax=Desulfonema magnum TaxID=45655 RepID=A0A975BEZ6_9BACT|nr:hypothetical protein [Desulfonema magnum]QTA84499.1 Uncharacterized protein dnm_004960 [Desulfonema magnum]
MKFIGYHGTDANNIDSIFNQGYKFSGKKEWFGEGIYFFEDMSPLTNGFTEARNWAIKVKHLKHWAVFQAEIETDLYIDLVFNDEHKKLFREIKEMLLGFHKKSGKNLKNFSDRAVFNLMAKEKKAELIRAPVNAGKFGGYYSPIIEKFQIQICVKQPECIKKNVLYKTGGKYESGNRDSERNS